MEKKVVISCSMIKKLILAKLFSSSCHINIGYPLTIESILIHRDKKSIKNISGGV